MKWRSRGGAIDRLPILIHPGSGGRPKCWPLPCFLEVGRRLLAHRRRVSFVIGPVEAERWTRKDIDAIRREFPLIESPEADELLGILAASRALISNDSGPAHLAALIGVPTVTIFGPTSPDVWRPIGPSARVVCGNPETRPDDWGVEPQCVVDLVS